MKWKGIVGQLDKILGFRTAGFILLGGFSILFILHIGVLLHFIPSETFWGGRIQSEEQLLSTELAALVITVLMTLPVFLRMRIWAHGKTSGLVGLWIIFVFMLLNTIGNLFAKTTTEKLLSIPALMLAICAYRLIRGNNKKVN